MNLNERYYRCFFTGHRKIQKSDEVAFKLRDEIEKLINEHNVTEFICGGAMGFDTLAARVVIRLKEKYEHIKLKIYVPCLYHYKNWSMRDQAMWRFISSFADEKVYITNAEYEDGCMHKRNRAMVNDAHFCIAYCNNSHSGTGVTLRFAREAQCDICNIYEYLK